MLAEVEFLEHLVVKFSLSRRSLDHQFLSQILCLIHTHRPIIYVHGDHLRQLRWELSDPPIGDLLSPPVVTLRRDIRCRDDSLVRVDEEKGKDLPMAWPRAVLQAKGLDAVLENIWKGDQAALLRENVTYVLNRRLLLPEAVDILQSTPIKLQSVSQSASKGNGLGKFAPTCHSCFSVIYSVSTP